MTSATAASAHGEYPAPLAPGAPPRDRRWVAVAALVGGLTLAGAAFSMTTRRLWPYESFSARFSFLYVWVAAVLILALGFDRRLFPFAGALFYAYLPFAQAAADQHLCYGDMDGAITFEMLLAVPLILVGLCGPRAPTPHPLPAGLKGGWIAILAAAALATLFAADPGVAAWTFLARFAVPIAVTLVLFRRLRDIADFHILTYGLVLGMFAVIVFGFQRSVEGTNISNPLTGEVEQRYAGLSVSSAVPAFYVMGVALWSARARAERPAFVSAVLWLTLAGLIPVLMWLGAHRAPLAAAGLLLVLWAPAAIRPILRRPLGLIPLLLGVGAVIWLARYSMETTALNTGFVVDRFKDLLETGLRGHNRVEIWSMALDGWRNSPFWGVGLNNLVVNTRAYLNVHSSVLGILYDMGLAGFLAFTLLFVALARMTLAVRSCALSREDRGIFRGHLVTWIVLLLMLAVDVPFTSGQPKNNIFVYLVFLYPLLCMIVYARADRAPAAGEARPPHSLPGDATLPPALVRPPAGPLPCRGSR